MTGIASQLFFILCILLGRIFADSEPIAMYATITDTLTGQKYETPSFSVQFRSTDTQIALPFVNATCPGVLLPSLIDNCFACGSNFTSTCNMPSSGPTIYVGTGTASRGSNESYYLSCTVQQITNPTAYQALLQSGRLQIAYSFYGSRGVGKFATMPTVSKGQYLIGVHVQIWAYRVLSILTTRTAVDAATVQPIARDTPLQIGETFVQQITCFNTQPGSYLGLEKEGIIGLVLGIVAVLVLCCCGIGLCVFAILRARRNNHSYNMHK